MRTEKMLKQFLAALLLLLLAACSTIAGAPAHEVAELLTMGRERPLREPMRPATPGPRVLILALDGVGAGVLERAVADGAMPRLATLLGEPRGDGLYRNAYSTPGVLSVLPSTTTAGWVSVFTGEPPGRTGIPGNEWFVREEAYFYAPVPVSLRDRGHATKLYTDELMSDLLRAPTLYERADVRSYVSMHPVFRGADLLVVANLASFGDLFGAVLEGAIEGGISADRKVHEETDLTSVGDLVASLRDRGVARLQTVYLPGIDLYTHVAADPLASQRTYLSEVTDRAIGEVLDAYEELGALDSTYVVLVSDHGHVPVLNDDRHALESEGDDEPPEVLRQAGFRVRAPSLTADPGDSQAVLAYQGAMAFVYLADRSACAAAGQGCDWNRPPRLDEDVLPAVRAFHAASESGAGVAALRGTLDLIVVTGGESPRVYDGERLVPLSDHLRRRPRPELLDLERRLRDLTTGPYGNRAGDIVLLSRFDPDGPAEERFYFSTPYHSEHGSAYGADSLVPLLVAGRGMSGEDLRGRVQAVLGEDASQLDVMPLVLELLGRR